MGEVVRVLQGIARSVDAAHAQRFAHGALKPQNISWAAPPTGPCGSSTSAWASRATPCRPATDRPTRPPGSPPNSSGAAPRAPRRTSSRRASSPSSRSPGVRSGGRARGRRPTSPPGSKRSRRRARRRRCAPKRSGSVLSPVLDVALHRALAQEPGERFRSVAELAEALASANQPAAGPAQFAATAFAPEGIGAPPPGPWSPAPTPAPQGPYGPPAQAAPRTARPPWRRVLSPSRRTACPGPARGSSSGWSWAGSLLVGALGVAAVFYTRGNAEAAAAAASASAAAASASAAAAAASPSAAAATGASAGATGAAAADAERGRAARGLGRTDRGPPGRPPREAPTPGTTRRPPPSSRSSACPTATRSPSTTRASSPR